MGNLTKKNKILLCENCKKPLNRVDKHYYGVEYIKSYIVNNSYKINWKSSDLLIEGKNTYILECSKCKKPLSKEQVEHFENLREEF